jgi:catechol 2,3-dioxygenase-like lactoylglutathione lyase family enzyme
MAALQGFHHVKLPVTDVERSRDWYQRVLGFEVQLEFVEDGVLMGVALRDPSGTVPLALRCDPDRANALSGFDPIAIGLPDDADAYAWRDRLDELGEPHGGIVTGHLGMPVLVGLHDPDGIELRLYPMGGTA